MLNVKICHFVLMVLCCKIIFENITFKIWKDSMAVLPINQG
jgi:hypothetical protein